MKLIFSLVASVLLSGCAGLSVDYVRTESQLSMKGFTPNVTAKVMKATTPAMEAGCVGGVAAEERSARVRTKSPDPRYRHIDPNRPDVSTSAKVRVVCN